MPDPDIAKVFELLGLSEESYRASFLFSPEDTVDTRATFIRAESTSSSPEESGLAELERSPQRDQGDR